MEKEKIEYAKRLSKIGDLIIEISNSIGKNGEGLNESIKRFKYAQESIADVNVPQIIQLEHKQLINTLNEWVNATKLLNDIKNDEDLNKAITLQKQKEIEIVCICKEIGDKLTR